MNETLDTDAINDRRLEIVELLDERFRLREDLARTRELEGTHARLRQVLHGPHRPQTARHD
jgi:hypothetical protein